MNVRWKKELRNLWPAFALASAGLIPAWLWPHEDAPKWILIILFGFGCAIMGSESFGMEFRQRTLSQLLAQPVSRPRIWREKMLPLGCALLAAWVLFEGFWIPLIRFEVFTDPYYAPQRTQIIVGHIVIFVSMAMIPLVAFCTGPWWTLVFQNSLLGTIFSLAVPAGIILLNTLVHELFRRPGMESPDDSLSVEVTAIGLMIVYSAVCYALGYSKLKKFQAIEGSSRDLQLSAAIEAKALAPFRSVFARFKGPTAALVRKELRLQQIPLAGAVLFTLIAIVGAILYSLDLKFADGGNIATPLLMTNFGVYVSAMPFLVGAISVAEEKTWGVSEWHKTLPPAMRRQWLVKMLVALLTSLLLGLVLPAALGLAGHSLLAARQSGPEPSPTYVLSSAALALVVGHLLLTSIVIYAATLSRSAISAIILSLGMIGLAAAVGYRAIRLFPSSVNLLTDEQMFSLQRVSFLVASVGMLILLGLVHRFSFFCYRTPLRRPVRIATQSLCLVALVWLSAAAVGTVIFFTHP